MKVMLLCLIHRKVWHRDRNLCTRSRMTLYCHYSIDHMLYSETHIFDTNGRIMQHHHVSVPVPAQTGSAYHFAHIHSAAQIAHKALYCIICFLCIVLTGIVDRSQYIIR